MVLDPRMMCWISLDPLDVIKNPFLRPIGSKVIYKPRDQIRPWGSCSVGEMLISCIEFF